MARLFIACTMGTQPLPVAAPTSLAARLACTPLRNHTYKQTDALLSGRIHTLGFAVTAKNCVNDVKFVLFTAALAKQVSTLFRAREASTLLQHQNSPTLPEADETHTESVPTAMCCTLSAGSGTSTSAHPLPANTSQSRDNTFELHTEICMHMRQF